MEPQALTLLKLGVGPSRVSHCVLSKTKEVQD